MFVGENVFHAGSGHFSRTIRIRLQRKMTGCPLRVYIESSHVWYYVHKNFVAVVNQNLIIEDGDCDGVPAEDDCDDSSLDDLPITVDADCDGILDNM